MPTMRVIQKGWELKQRATQESARHEIEARGANKRGLASSLGGAPPSSLSEESSNDCSC